jgi:hypothetical protein
MSKRHYGKQTGRPVTHEIPTPAGGVRLETFIPWRLVQHGSRNRQPDLGAMTPAQVASGMRSKSWG